MGIFPCLHINNRTSEYSTVWNMITRVFYQMDENIYTKLHKRFRTTKKKMDMDSNMQLIRFIPYHILAFFPASQPALFLPPFNGAEGARFVSLKLHGRTSVTSKLLLYRFLLKCYLFEQDLNF
jgi:hypothetical protein